MRGFRAFCGNLPKDIQEKEVEDIFFKYGKIDRIDLRTEGRTPHALVTFESRDDCSEAIRGRNNYNYDGYRLDVRIPREDRSRSPPGRFGGDRRGGGRGGSPRRFDGPSRGGDGPRGARNDQGQATYNKVGGPSKRTDFRIVIRNLPRSGSWQDIKDHMREAGDVMFADVLFDDNVGIVEFAAEDDMIYAVKNLNETKFKSHEGETAIIEVSEDIDGVYKGKTSRGFGMRFGGGGRGGYGGYGRDRYRSRSRSPPRGRRSPDYNRGGGRSRF